MILLFELIAITSIWVLGLTILTQPKMLLGSIRNWADTKGQWVEPLIRCHWCMPSVHSLIGYGFAIGMGLIQQFSWFLVVIYPLVALGSSLINGLIWGWHLKIESETTFYNKAVGRGDGEDEEVNKF